MPRIKKLPPKVQSALQSGITVTNTSRCVLELVQNSLDAGATSITVNINLRTFNILVTDNGIGLTQSDFTDIGKRYMTSKCHSLHDFRTQIKYYGFRGEALASIRESCRTLTIISKAKWSTTSVCKVFLNGADTGKLEQSEQLNNSHGTIIKIDNFLYNQPVRRNRINPAMEMEKIRKNLLPVALINYKVSFTLKNDVTNKVVLESQPSESIDKTLQNLCETAASNELVSITAAMKKFRVSGYISKLTEVSSKYQFVYVNKHYIKKNKIHTFINKCLAKSFYLRGISQKRLPKTKNFTSDIEPEYKNTNAVFIINIECPLIEYDICFSPEKTVVEFKSWPTVLECIEKSIYSFFNEEPKKVNCLVLNKGNEKHKSHKNLVEQVIGKLQNTAYKKSKEFNKKSYIQDNNKLHCLFKKPDYKVNYFVTGNSLKYESENPFTSSVESKQIVSHKKRKFTDHVITESEMDETPHDQHHYNKNLKLNNNSHSQRKRSILPVVSQVFFKSNIHEIQSVLKVLKENKKASNMSSDYTLCEINSNCFKNKKKDCITKVNIRRKVDFTVDFLFKSPVKKMQNATRHKLDFYKARPFLRRSSKKVSNMDFKISDAGIKKNNHTVKKQNSNCTVTLNSAQMQVRNVNFHNQNTGSHHLFQSPRKITCWSPVEFDVKNQQSDKLHTSCLYSKQRISFPLHKRHNKKELFVSKVNNNTEMCCNSIKKTKFDYRHNGCSYFNIMRQQKENVLGKNKIIINNHHGANNSKSELKYKNKNICNGTRHFNPGNESLSVFCRYTNQSFSPFNKTFHRKHSVTNTVDYGADKNCSLFCKPQEYLLFEESVQPGEGLTFKEVMHSPYLGKISKLSPDLQDEKLYDLQSYTITMDKNNFSSGLRKTHRKPNELLCSDEGSVLNKNNLQTDHISYIPTAKETVVLKQDSLFLTHMLRNTVIIVDLNSPIKGTIQQENKTIKEDNTHIAEKKSQIYLVNRIHNSCDVARHAESKSYNCQKEECKLTDTKNTIKNYSATRRLKVTDTSKQEEINCTSQTIENTNVQDELNTAVIYDSFISPISHCDTKTMFSMYKANKNILTREDDTTNNIKLSLLSSDIILSSDSENQISNIKETTESIFTPFTNQSANCKSHLLDEDDLLPSFEINKKNKYFIHPFPILPNYKTNNTKEIKNKFRFSPVNILHTQQHFNFGKNNEKDKDEERKLMFCTKSNTHQLHHNNNTLVNYVTSETDKTCINKIEKTKVKIAEDNNMKSFNKESGVNTLSLDNSQWLKQTLPNGISIYVHSKTGMSSYFTPVSLSNKYLMKRRRWFMPKGSSPLLNYLKKAPKEVRKLNDYEKDALQEAVFVKADMDELSSIKWRGFKPNITGSEDILSKLICEAKIPDDVTKLIQEGKPVIFNKLICNLQSFTKSFVFTCDSFLTAKVVGQVDCKFIAIMIKDNKHGELLVLLDQHAVDERIQYEKLIADYKGKNNQVMMSNINPGIYVTLTKAEVQLLSHFKAHFEQSGLQIAVNQSAVTITSVPTCLYNRSMKEGSNQSKSILKSLTIQLIKEELECLQETKGVGGTLPNVIHTVISYEACRGAVKFGDTLSVKSTEKLIQQLAQCSLPFQCAHGRPVLAPLVSFDNIHCELMNLKPNLKNLKLKHNDEIKNC